MEGINLDSILMFIFFLYVGYCQEEMLFYGTMKKYCKKHNGNCVDCACWSCPRKLHKDEYLEKKKGNING